MNVLHTSLQAAPVRAGQRPLRWAGSLLIFGIPTLLTFAAFHLGIPALQNAGLTPFEAFVVANIVPMALLFAAALAAVVAEQSITSLAGLRLALAGRMRFPRLTGKALLQGLGLYALMLLGGGLAAMLGRALLDAGLIPLPAELPLLLDPRAAISGASLAAFAGGQLAGNWGLVILFALRLFFNIAGEELWWRGYVLPRQELAFGRSAWLVHALLWWGFHAFKWWDMLTVLPLALLLSYGAQRTQNNWVPTIAHLLANSLLMLLVLGGVLGLIG